MTENRTTPKKRLNAQDLVSIAYRGLSPGGLQQLLGVKGTPGDMDDPPTFSEDVESYIEPDSQVALQQNIVPIPIVIVDDITHTRRRVDRRIVTNTATIDAVTPQMIVPRNSYRTQTILENLGPGIAYLGHNESIGVSGFALSVNSVLVLGTTEPLYCIQQSAQASLGLVSVIQEYDKDTVE